MMIKEIKYWLTELFEINLEKKLSFLDSLFSNLYQKIEFFKKRLCLSEYPFFLFCSLFFAAAQKSERIHYFEAAIAANYSMSADATQNLPGFGVGVFFHPFSLKKM